MEPPVCSHDVGNSSFSSNYTEVIEGGDKTPQQSPRVRTENLPGSGSFISSLGSPLTRRVVSTPVSPRSPTVRRSRSVRHVAEHETGDREWSVFGQLMENEGQLRSPGSLKMKIRTSRIVGRDRSDTINSLSGSILEGSTSHTTPSIIRSPIQEASPLLNDHSDEQDIYQDTETDSGSDYASDEEASKSTAQNSSILNKLSGLISPELPSFPVLYKNILKCVVAYFIASLFTFIPVLAHLTGNISANGEKRPSPSGHMVATVYALHCFVYCCVKVSFLNSAVYFNPAKTAGAMLEADMYCIFGLAWAAFISLGSMGMFWWIDVKPGWEWLADVVVIVWIGLGMTVVAWMKVWMAKPSFNTGNLLTLDGYVNVAKLYGSLQYDFHHTFCRVSYMEIIDFLDADSLSGL